LAMLYDTQGQYAKAEPLFRRALAIREKALARLSLLEGFTTRKGAPNGHHG